MFSHSIFSRAVRDSQASPSCIDSKLAVPTHWKWDDGHVIVLTSLQFDAPFRVVLLLAFATLALFVAFAVVLRWHQCVNHAIMALIALDGLPNLSSRTSLVDASAGFGGSLLA